jgi:hypothetical protein
MNHFNLLCKRNPHHAVVDPHGRLARRNSRTMTKAEWQAHWRDYRQSIREWSRFGIDCAYNNTERGRQLTKVWYRDFSGLDSKRCYSDFTKARGNWRLVWMMDHSRIIHPKPGAQA